METSASSGNLPVEDAVTLNGKTLIVAIRAVRGRQRELETKLEQPDGEALQWLQVEYLDVVSAAAELKRVYERLAAEADNLPTYREVVEEP